MAQPPLQGQVNVLLVRLDALKDALDQQPERTSNVEFQYDRVRRAATKLAQSLGIEVAR